MWRMHVAKAGETGQRTVVRAIACKHDAIKVMVWGPVYLLIAEYLACTTCGLFAPGAGSSAGLEAYSGAGEGRGVVTVASSRRVDWLAPTSSTGPGWGVRAPAGLGLRVRLLAWLCIACKSG